VTFLQLWLVGRKPKPKKSEWSVLEPRKFTQPGKLGKPPKTKWRVSLGVTIENGKRKNTRRIFDNQADALRFCENEEARRFAHGQITAKADGTKVAAWLELEEKLIKAGAGSLEEVGKRVLKDTLAITKTSTATLCLSNYLTKHLGPSVYADDSRNRCNQFIKWFGAERSIKEATPEVMQAFFAKQTGATLRRTVSAWLGWSVDQGYLPSNPCARKRQRSGTKKKKAPEAVILSPTEAAALLRAAVSAKDWTSLSFIAIGLFAGLRPMEFRKKYKGASAVYLEWSNVTADGVELGPELAKTAARVVSILDPLPLWIDLIRKERGVLSGPVLAAGKRGGGWRKHWEKFLTDHWKHKWHADQLRHSFGSYRMASVKSAGQVAMDMGNSARVVLAHYWNWQTKARDAEEYWKLTPETVMNSLKTTRAGTGKFKA